MAFPFCAAHIREAGAFLSRHLAKRFGRKKVTCIHNAVDIEELHTTRDSAALRRELKTVLFLGHRSDRYHVLQAMDIFVLSSLSEGIPMVLLEALALARPVVATRVGGIPEVIEHGVNGLLVAQGNHEALA